MCVAESGEDNLHISGTIWTVRTAATKARPMEDRLRLLLPVLEEINNMEFIKVKKDYAKDLKMVTKEDSAQAI